MQGGEGGGSRSRYYVDPTYHPARRRIYLSKCLSSQALPPQGSTGVRKYVGSIHSMQGQHGPAQLHCEGVKVQLDLTHRHEVVVAQGATYMGISVYG